MISNYELERHVYDKVCQIITRNIDPNAKLTPDTHYDDLWMDCLDQVELLMWVEDEFDIDICDEAWEKCTTIQSVVNLVSTLEPTIKLDNGEVVEKKDKSKCKQCWWCGKR